MIIKIDAKENWFQSDDAITLALYGLKGARLADGKSTAELRGGKILTVKFYNNIGVQLFERTWNFVDYIVGKDSKITLNSANVQIVLKKGNTGIHWKSLTVEEAK